MLLAACGRMPPGRIRSARVEERSSVRCSGSNGTLSQDTGAFSLTCTFAMLSFAVHEKEKEGDIACCLSSVHVRVGFDMFGSVIGGGRIESSHRIFHVSAGPWPGCWRDRFGLSFVEYLFSLHFAYLLICEIQNSSTSHNTQTPEGRVSC